MDRANHYEAAFEASLREQKLPCIAVDETRRSALGDGFVKSLDFLVVPEDGSRLLIDIKGRRFPGGPPKKPRYVWENWVSREDVDCLLQWQECLGSDSTGLFVFVYELAPSIRLTDGTADLWTFRGKNYLARAVTVETYQRWMKQRSPKWETVCLASDVYREIVQPFSTFARVESEILWPA